MLKTSDRPRLVSSLMSVIRLTYVQDPKEEEQAEEVWKTECAFLMIQQKGCLSETLQWSRLKGCTCFFN